MTAEQASNSPLPVNSTQAQQGKTQNKRGHKPRKNTNSFSKPQIDGSVSDSVTNIPGSPRSQRTPKYRQQSVAAGALPVQNGYYTQPNGYNKSRPASLGGNFQPSTPSKEQAYAGPTFAASPAPSSLPVPKFFSKSVPNISAQGSLQATAEAERKAALPADDTSPESENASPVPPPRSSVKSPLDLLFNADRRERSQRQSVGDKSALLQELDGESASSPRTLPANNSGQSSTEDQQLEASTKALKDLLFNQSASPAPRRPHPFQQYSNTPPPLERSTSVPVTPGQAGEQQPNYFYGNRHLSPMFQAVRNDTPPPQASHTQQQIYSPNLPPRHPQSPLSHPSLPPQNSHPNFPQQPNHDLHHRPSLPTGPAPGLTWAGATQDTSANSGASPRSNSGTKDIKGMEDEIRRMLKLNVLS